MTRDEIDAYVTRKVNERYTWRRVLQMCFWPIIAPTLLIVGMLGLQPLAQSVDQGGGLKVTDAPTFVNEPMSLSIGTLVTIHPDGRITYGPNYTPDAAARAFWEAITRVRQREMAMDVAPSEAHLLKQYRQLSDADRADVNRLLSTRLAARKGGGMP